MLIIIDLVLEMKWQNNLMLIIIDLVLIIIDLVLEMKWHTKFKLDVVSVEHFTIGGVVVVICVCVCVRDT